MTEDDDGRAVVLRTGAEVPLRLSSRWSWDGPRTTGEAVRLDPVDHLVDPGFVEWVVVALAPGPAEIAFDGTPGRTVRITVEVRD